MSLPTSPPKYSSWSAMVRAFSRKEYTPWQAFSVQRVVGVSVDGVFGSLTERAVKTWQASMKLTADGVVGPKTQGAMLRKASESVDVHFTTIPDGMLLGFARVEGANLLAATNWSVPGGVDCGCVQMRVYGPPYDLLKLKEAFDPTEAFTYAARVFTSRVAAYKRSNPTGLSVHRIIEAAVLAHNWPAGAAQVMKYGHVLNPDDPATWTRKSDGTHYTKGEWSFVYPQRVLQGVSY
jgi:hypothetical protein